MAIVAVRDTYLEIKSMKKVIIIIALIFVLIGCSAETPEPLAVPANDTVADEAEDTGQTEVDEGALEAVVEESEPAVDDTTATDAEVSAEDDVDEPEAETSEPEPVNVDEDAESAETSDNEVEEQESAEETEEDMEPNNHSQETTENDSTQSGDDYLPLATPAATAIAPAGSVDVSQITPEPPSDDGENVVMPPPGVPGTTLPVPAALDTLMEDIYADVMQRSGAPREDVEITSIEEVVWPDSGIGCHEEGMMYMQVLTDGFRIIFNVYGVEYHYHTNAGNYYVYCATPAKDGGPAPVPPSSPSSDT